MIGAGERGWTKYSPGFSWIKIAWETPPNIMADNGHLVQTNQVTDGLSQAYSTGGPRANSGPPIKSDRPADQFR